MTSEGELESLDGKTARTVSDPQPASLSLQSAQQVCKKAVQISEGGFSHSSREVSDPSLEQTEQCTGPTALDRAPLGAPLAEGAGVSQVWIPSAVLLAEPTHMLWLAAIATQNAQGIQIGSIDAG